MTGAVFETRLEKQIFVVIRFTIELLVFLVWVTHEKSAESHPGATRYRKSMIGCYILDA
jgi:hypothetical protein